MKVLGGGDANCTIRKLVYATVAPILEKDRLSKYRGTHPVEQHALHKEGKMIDYVEYTVQAGGHLKVFLRTPSGHLVIGEVAQKDVEEVKPILKLLRELSRVIGPVREYLSWEKDAEEVNGE